MHKQSAKFRTVLRLGGGAAIFSIIVGCSTLTHKDAPLLSKGPYLQAPGSNTMTIMWESLTNHPGLVRFGLDGKLDQQSDSVEPRKMVGLIPIKRTNLVVTLTNDTFVIKTNVANASRTNLFYVYQARLTGLRPGARYTYAVEVNGAQTDPRTFKTFDPQADSVRFIAYGDSRSNPKVHRSLARRFSEHSPEFVIHNGDLVYAGKNYALWSKEFFEPASDFIDHVPIVAVPGNHEEDLVNYLTYFPIRGSNNWFSFDAGPVHVLAIDYYYEWSTSDQFKFARQDLLNSKAPWKVVFLHNPIFNYGGHSSGWGHKYYLSLLHEGKVDLVLSGHSHLYERFRPIAPTNQPGAWPITFVTTAGGGAELHDSYPHPAHAAAISTHHYMAFEATRDTLSARAIGVDGREIDSFEIRKPGGQPTAEFLAQVYPEEWLKISYEVGPNLQGKLATLPTNQQPAMAMLTIPPLKTYERPVELEITLAPHSAKNYAVDELPLRVTTPAPGGSNKVAWVTVRAIGKKKVKGDELNPPLVFRGRVMGDFGETVAYGSLSRTSRTAADAARKRVPKAAGE